MADLKYVYRFFLSKNRKVKKIECYNDRPYTCNSPHR